MTGSRNLYRKKPVVVVAHRIGDDGWPDEIWQGVIDNKIIFRREIIGGIEFSYVEIKTLEGTMIGDDGDWIIRGVQGEFYPCKDEIFRATYEEVK